MSNIACKPANDFGRPKFKKVCCIPLLGSETEGKGTFSVEKGYVPLLGLSIADSDLITNPTGVGLFSTNVLKMWITIELREPDSFYPFYSATVALSNNFAFRGEWPPNYGGVVGGLEPFPFHWSATDPTAVETFKYGRDALPLRGGRLKANRKYEIKVKLLKPIALTNDVCFWIREGVSP